MLTVRQFKIINKMLILERSVKIKELSEMYGVSERTIKYDLEAIRDFLKDLEITLKSQTNKGIWIACNDDEKIRTKNALTKLQNENLYYDQETRAKKIILNIFASENFVTAEELANSLNVNRNTVFNDMDYVGNILKDSGILLMRKSGQGFALNEDENKIRGFIENLALKSLSSYDVYNLTEKVKSGSTISAAEAGLSDNLDKYCRFITLGLYNAYLEDKDIFVQENIALMVIRLIISLFRCDINKFYDGNKHTVSKDLCSPLFKIWADIFISAGFDAYLSELEYVNGKPLSGVTEKKADIPALTEDLLSSISKESGIAYLEDATLYSRLLSHLTLSLNDSKSDVKENPFSKTIITNHKGLFDAIRSTCKRHLPDNPLIYNEDFISYIVLHFLVAQSNIARLKKFKAILVCATGRGAAKLIQKMIESEVKEISIIANCSLSDIELLAESYKPDYIISVFPVKSHIPVIVVEPIPTKEDLRFLKKTISDRLDEDILQDGILNLGLSLSSDVKNAEEISLSIINSGLNILNKLSQSDYKVKEGISLL